VSRTTPEGRSPAVLPLALLFLLSGASGLVYETAWSRIFQDLFGHTVHTNAAVLAGFMAGLGLGAGVAGRYADLLRRPVRAYALLEIAVVVLVWTSPAQVAAVDRVLPVLAGAGWAETAWASLLRWLAAFVLVVAPTSLMGATLPVLCRARIATDAEIGRVFGSLYGANTIGAVVGVLAAGSWLIRSVGVEATLRIGCGLGLAAALGALLLPEGAPPAPRGPRVRGDRVVPRPVLVAVFVSGFVVLAAEVVWIRVLAFVLDSNILSFTLVLGSLLLALGVGSVLFPRLVTDRRRHLAAFGWIQLAVGLAVGGTVVVLVRLDRAVELLSALAPGDDPFSSWIGRGAIAAAVLLVPGLLMGAALPAATGAVRGREGAARGIGSLYAATTLGNICGALAAGYLLIPLAGGGRTLVAVAAASAASGVAVLAWRREGRSVMRPAAAAAIAAVMVGWLWAAVSPQLAEALAGRRNPHAVTVAVEEGIRGTVTISDVPPLPVVSTVTEPWRGVPPVAAGYRMIAVDGVDVAGTSPDLRTTQRMQAHLPLLLHGSARRVLQVGFGSGETTFEVLRHPGLRFDVAEINPDVVRFATRHFPQFAADGWRAVFADARNWVRTSRDTYDVILNDSTYPGIAGSSLLYSADHLAACRDRLAPGGIVSTWLPVDLPPESLRVVLATYRSAFPHVSFWLATNCLNKHGVLVGSLEPQERALARLRSGGWPAEVSAGLADSGYGDPEVLASVRVLDGADIEALAAGAEVNSDDRPILEYPARGVEVAADAYWRETVRLILSRFGPPAPGPARDTLRECVRRILSGQLALLDGDPDLALEFYRRAAATAPRHPGPRRLAEDIRIFRAQAAFEDAAAAAARGETDRVLERLRLATELFPRSAPVRLELGRALLAAGRPGEAAPHLEAALVLAERLPEVLLLHGDAALASGRAAEAEASYRAHLEVVPASPRVVAALGEAVAAGGRPDEAAGLLRRALELAPDDPAIARRLAELHGGG